MKFLLELCFSAYFIPHLIPLLILSPMLWIAVSGFPVLIFSILLLRTVRQNQDIWNLLSRQEYCKIGLTVCYWKQWRKVNRFERDLDCFGVLLLYMRSDSFQSSIILQLLSNFSAVLQLQSCLEIVMMNFHFSSPSYFTVHLSLTNITNDHIIKFSE